MFSAFSACKVRVLLLQVAIGQYGLDLSTAQTCIYFSNSLSRKNRSQSEDRILLPGKREPLLYIDLTTAHSIDGDVQRLLRRKEKQSISMLELARELQRRRREDHV